MWNTYVMSGFVCKLLFTEKYKELFIQVLFTFSKVQFIYALHLS